MKPALPDPDSRSDDQVRQRLMLKVTVAIFLISAVILLILPIRLPKPVRLAVVATDLLAAAVIWLMGRQRYR